MTIMLRRFESDEHVTLSDDESDAELDSDDSDGDSEDDSDDGSDDDALFNDEEQHPPEYYLAEADRLDVSQLRQQRYSPKTQNKLEETRDYWDR